MKCLLYAELLVMYSETQRQEQSKEEENKEFCREKGTQVGLGPTAGSALASQ